MASKRVDKKNLKEFAEELKINANILKRNYSYTIDQTVNKGQVVLKCTVAGTTDKEALNLSSVSIGDTLTDGTAEWQVISTTGYGSGSGGTSISEWATATSYESGNIVIYGDSLYGCNTDHTSTTFSSDESNWTLIYSDLKDWDTSIYYKVGVVVIQDKKIYKCITAHTSSTFSTDLVNWKLIGGGSLEDWVANKNYEAEDIFVYDGQIYRALVGFTSGATFAEINILNDYTLALWQANTSYTAGEYFEESGVVYEVLNNFTSGATFAVTSDIAVYTPITWASGTNVNVNDLVEDSGNYYIALVNFTCGDTFTKVAFEEYVPKPFTDQQVEEIIEAFNPVQSGSTGFVVVNSAPAHNALYRGKDLTDYWNSGQMSIAIANGSFENIFPGDYIIKSVTVNGTTYADIKWISNIVP